MLFCIIDIWQKIGGLFMNKRMLFILIFALGALGLYVSLNFEKDYDSLSINELYSLAEDDDAQAQFLLGVYYQYGAKVEADLGKSFKWYLQSAENGNAEAMVNLGYLYGNGIGTEEDLSKAFEWNLKAAKLGNESGMFNVGKKYELGIGVAEDKEQAKYWLEKSGKNEGV